MIQTLKKSFVYIESNNSLTPSKNCDLEKGFKHLNGTSYCVLHPKQIVPNMENVFSRLTKRSAIDYCKARQARLPTDEETMLKFTNTMKGAFLKPPSFWFGAHFDESLGELVSDYAEESIRFKSDFMYSTFNYAKMLVTSKGVWWSTSSRSLRIPCLSKSCFNYINMIDLSAENCTIQGKKNY